MLTDIFRKKHILWIRLMYAGIIVQNSETSKMLESFAEVEFRHMRWLGEEILKRYREFDYQENVTEEPPRMFDFNNDIPDLPKDFMDLLETLKDDLKVLVSCYTENFDLGIRFKSDEEYFIHRIEKTMEQRDLKTYDSFDSNADEMAEKNNISVGEANFVISSMAALLNKEYDSVLSFFYIITHLENREYAEILSDLLQESLSHFKYYAVLMSSFGVLKLPEKVDTKSYMITSLKDFIDNNVLEETEEIKKMGDIASKIRLEDYKNLLRFIEEQEKHHITLLETVRDAIA